jgi:hypothetical protein
LYGREEIMEVVGLTVKDTDIIGAFRLSVASANELAIIWS